MIRSQSISGTRILAALGLPSGSYASGNIPIFTTTGLQDSGQALVSTMVATSVWSNNTSSSAAPAANTVLTLGTGTAGAPIYSFNASPTTGLFSSQTDTCGISIAGNLGVKFSTANSAAFMEYFYSSGVIWRANGGTNVDAMFASQGTGEVYLKANGAGTNSIMARFTHPGTAGVAANYLRVSTAASGSGPILSCLADGTGDSNIDLVLSPLGTGVLQFGTNTAKGAEAFASYITIKDSGGTLRKIMVCA